MHEGMKCTSQRAAGYGASIGDLVCMGGSPLPPTYACLDAPCELPLSVSFGGEPKCEVLMAINQGMAVIGPRRVVLTTATRRALALARVAVVLLGDLVLKAPPTEWEVSSSFCLMMDARET